MGDRGLYGGHGERVLPKEMRRAGGVPPLKGEELQRISAQLPDWTVVEDHHIQKSFSFPDFRQALEFVNRVGEVAEDQGHHPDLTLSWGRVEIRIFTHKINGLTESDFVLAAKMRLPGTPLKASDPRNS
jgi:4a-hydroxytetrahydrobiopterin dehydratase